MGGRGSVGAKYFGSSTFGFGVPQGLSKEVTLMRNGDLVGAIVNQGNINKKLIIDDWYTGKNGYDIDNGILSGVKKWQWRETDKAIEVPMRKYSSLDREFTKNQFLPKKAVGIEVNTGQATYQVFPTYVAKLTDSISEKRTPLKNKTRVTKFFNTKKEIYNFSTGKKTQITRPYSPPTSYFEDINK